MDMASTSPLPQLFPHFIFIHLGEVAKLSYGYKSPWWLAQGIADLPQEVLRRTLAF